MKITLPLLPAVLWLQGASFSQAETSPRERILFTSDWRFLKGDPGGVGGALTYEQLKPWLLPTANAFASKAPATRPVGRAPGEEAACTKPSFDDSGWRALNLPHDWGIEGAFDQALPGETGKLPWSGAGWYRKTFELPASDAARRIALEIDGAMSFSAVWCNGSFVGGWPYGYASYRLDLTSYLKPGESNTLAIRLDNPPESSRWYPGGGIYRNVWLVKTGPVHLEPLGTFVTTPDVSESSATVKIQTGISNTTGSPARVDVVTQIFPCSSSGEIGEHALAGSEPVALAIAPGATKPVTLQLKLSSPRLWDTQDPHLYAAVTSVRQDGRTVDRYGTTFGVRTIRFTAADGFHLNGRRVPLQGVCLHHDLGALGAAFNIRAAERQIAILKEMGANAIRTAHNPPAPELLDLCDRHGMLVIDEFADCWKLGKKPNGYNRLFADWSEADVRSYVRRDRNHPSIILWSIGNEIREQDDPEGPDMGRELTRIVHEEDATRPTAIAVNSVDGGYNGFQMAADVFGYNYKPGEYRKFRAANPLVPLFGSETSSTISTRGEYFFPASHRQAAGRSDFQVSSYDLCAPDWATLPDREFQGQEENPFVAGEFVWTGFDYLGEPTPYGQYSTILLNYHTPEAQAKAGAELQAPGKNPLPSRSSYFGILDLAGFKKDRFYLYQSRWRPDLPMAHVLPHWSWPGREGEITPVHVYTSGDEAELFLNGQSLGRKKRGKGEFRLRWDDVKYQPGQLKVIAYKHGKPWAEDEVRTAGPAAKLLLAADRAALQNDGRDLAFVTVTVADQDGRMVPRSHAALEFALEGPGEILATDNGDPIDQTSFQATRRAAFNGLALVVVRARAGAEGSIKLRVSSEGLSPAEVVLHLVGSEAGSLPRH